MDLFIGYKDIVRPKEEIYAWMNKHTDITKIIILLSIIEIFKIEIKRFKKLFIQRLDSNSPVLL